MTPSPNRSILGFASILLLILITYLLFILPINIDWNKPFHYNLAFLIASVFNVAILFSWFSFGAFLGITITILSCVATLVALFRIGLFREHIFIVSFIFSAGLGYLFSKISIRLNQLYALKTEKMEEKINILSNAIKMKKNSILSFKERFNRYSILKEVVESLSSTLSLDIVNNLIIEKTLKVVGKGGRVLLFLVDRQRQELMLSISHGEPKVKMKKGDLFDQWVLRNRISLIIEDITKDFRFTTEDIEKSKPIFRSLISTPLMSENKVMGILRMDSLKESNFVQDDLRLLDFISDLGAVAIQNSLLYSRTQGLAIRDGLTGLFVQRYFMERLREEIRRSSRDNRPFSLLMLDIDNFKEYNDKYGHISGDIALKHLAGNINTMTQEGDILARYGGEEFIILLLGRDKYNASKKAEAIRKKIKSEPVILRRQKMDITVSIGVSSYPEDNILAEELIKTADDRLYKAKAMGRNRVCANS